MVVGARPSMESASTADSRVIDPITGQVPTIEELYHRGMAGEDVAVMSLDESTSCRRPPEPFR